MKARRMPAGLPSGDVDVVTSGAKARESWAACFGEQSLVVCALVDSIEAEAKVRSCCPTQSVR